MKDLSHHKTVCKGVAKFEKIVKKEKAKLRRLYWKDGECHRIPDGDTTTKSILETNIGAFGTYGIEETYAYITARSNMAKYLNAMALMAEYPTLPLWKEVAYEIQECLRLNENDDASAGSCFPFVLINCDRDEDALAFVLNKTKQKHGCGNDKDDWYKVHVQSNEGDWIYGHSDLYTDIFKETGEKHCRFSQLPHFVAVLIIKLRLVAAFVAKKKEGIEVLENEAVQIREVREMQIPDLLEVIHKANPTILPALINPIPLLSQIVPPLSVFGKPSEAANVLIDAIAPFNRTKGARKVLIRRFGSNPTYDTDCNVAYGLG